MLSLKELRKLAMIAYGYYAVLLDGSTAFVGDKPPAAEFMKEYKALYYMDEVGWKKWDQKGWTDIPSQPTDLDLSEVNKPVATTTTKQDHTDKTAVIRPELWGKTVKDKEYRYTITSDGKKFFWRSDTRNGSHTIGDNGWAKMVNAINPLPLWQDSDANPSTSTPQATTGPATPEAAKPETAKPEADQLTVNVAKILSNIDSGHTYGGRTLFTNEKAIVRNKIAALKKWALMRNAAIDAPLQLAMIVVAYNRQSLASSKLASVGPEDLAAMSEREIQKAFGQELSTILRGVTSFAKMTAENLVEYNRATRKAKQDTKKSSAKYPAKIIRLASLRRLRVRSEMVAAITGSAMPGRDRVA